MSLEQFSTTPQSPARKWNAITESPDVLDPRPFALWANQACTITIEGEDGTSETFTIAAAGPVDLAPVKITDISTGTIIGLFL